ncbi:putative GTP pyrophosphokinase [Caminicella sporogenes DSM 14501]|uniref:Putative GTP pyrophosphokinase n=1 Tax=Caminicella sporogenes DSM 14501 TaxID=1121266 RepID=A0A1M6N423_9FIRM|nr:GTP pyrophosphokinase family protein [Caminicella sporogenes]RKD22372.1 GTP pyrophosphokinase [Caminicella sporogenes]WIF95175.1 GTP pyrophosphokinase family protein [Caminicella sporogenes]SHJ90406.1 putative GTP pyrophosphokinase [Caminicella sporogenes DSM 14501]
MQKIRRWKEILIPYEQAVEELKVKFKSIRNELRDMNEYSPIEFVTGRVKKISSILEKAKRYNIPEDKIEEKIEDIAGIRIMCQFEDDIYKVVDLIRKRDGKDLKIVYEKDYIKNKKDSGYRSYHVIIKYPVQTALGEKEIFAELQIRTLAMNFWATIEHSLNYKYKKNIPENIKVRLRKAAEAAYLLDQEMREIRDEIIRAQKMFEEKSNNVTDIVNNIQLLNLIGYEKEAREFQDKFDEIWEKGSLAELENLSETIRRTVRRYQTYNL